MVSPHPEPGMLSASRYVVCSPSRAARLGLGDRSEEFRHIDPWRVESAGFIGALNALHRAHAAHESLTIPAWALYDCAESSGLIFGLGSADEPAQIPHTMLAATPGMVEGEWHCLAFCGRRGLLGETLDAWLGLIRPARMTGVVRWSDRSLRLLVARGRLGLLTAWTPAHSDPSSATYLLSGEAPERSRAGSERVRLVPGDAASMQRAQAEIEAGRRAWIAEVDDTGAVWLEIEPA